MTGAPLDTGKNHLRTALFLMMLPLIGIGLCNQSSVTTPANTWQRDSSALSLREKARLLYESESFDSALVYAQMAANRAEKKQDWHTWGEAHTYIMAAQYFLGQAEAAAADFPRLEQQATAVIPVDSAFWTDYFNTAAAIYNDLGNYEAAIRLGRKEIDYYEKTNNVASLALARNNVGAYYLNRGDYDRALEYMGAALQGYSSVPDAFEDQVWTCFKLSEAFYFKTDYPRAIEYAEKGLGILQAHCPNAAYEVNLRLCLGAVYADTKVYEKSLSNLLRALSLEENKKNSANLVNILISLGAVYTKTKQFTAAESSLQRALQPLKPSSINYGRACRYMGLLQQAKGHLWPALEWKQKSLMALSGGIAGTDLLENPRLEGINGYNDFMKGLGEKAQILRALAQQESNPALLESAFLTLDLATAVLDSMRTIYQEGSKQFWNQSARPILENAIDLALQLRESTGKEMYLEKAFTYAEKGRAYLLSESLRESAARQKAGIPEAVVQQEKQIKIDVAFYKKQIFEAQQRKDADTSKILLWQAEILRLHRAQETLLTQMEQQYPDYYQIKYQPNISGLRDVQRKMPENTGLLEYFQGDSAVYVFYMDGQHARARRCAPEGSLLRLLSDLRNQDTVQSRGRGPAAVQAFARDAHAVYEHFIAPLVDALPQQLVVIPDGQLAYLPFDLLLTENSATQQQPTFATLPYLLQKTTIRYEYSAFLAFQSGTRRRNGRFFQGYAPDYSLDLATAAARGETTACMEWPSARFAPLPNNRKEVTAIAAITEGSALLGPEASETNFRKNSGNCRILHLAMHGFLNDCDPAYSGLVFSPVGGQATEDNDGILHAFEIYNLRLQAELAVLSACNTGRGQFAKGEGVISLARAFKYAGCPNVLMSLWQADDKATAAVMTGFYEGLNQGLGKAAAIRQAKLNYIHQTPQNHPFYWAAFVLMGDNEPLHSATPWFWYVLALLMAAGIFWIIKRRKF